jgi:ribonuclease P/MRP protein subunit POP3
VCFVSCEFRIFADRILRPLVPLNLQNAILAEILRLLDGASEYQTQRFAASRKRKRRAKVSETKRQKLEVDEPQSSTINRKEEDVPPIHSEHTEVFESPTLFRHLIYGINEVTKRLENQTHAVRRPVIAVLPEQPEKDSLPALQSIFVCRSDMNPSLVIDHLPHLVAAYNSTRPPSSVSLVPLPKGAELSLAQALGIRRVAVFGIDVGGLSRYLMGWFDIIAGALPE